jgi:hypothetical protein
LGARHRLPGDMYSHGHGGAAGAGAAGSVASANEPDPRTSVSNIRAKMMTMNLEECPEGCGCPLGTSP